MLRFRSTCGRAYPRPSLLGMARIVRLVKLAGAVFGFLLYVWYEAVRYAPDVKRRKARRRRERGGPLGN